MKIDLNNSYKHDSQALLDYLSSSVDGLNDISLEKNLAKYGVNQIPEDKKFKSLALFLSQFKNAIVVLMIIAGLISYFLGHRLDTILIFVMVLINALMGFFQEFRAEKSIEALKGMLVDKCIVRRNGKLHEIPNEDLTVGDIVILSDGDNIPADLRILVSNNASVNEASLTGESLPVEKNAKTIQKDQVVADRKNMLYMGTHLVQGNAEGLVIAIAKETELGKIADDLKEIDTESEHYVKKVTTLSKQMGTVAIASATVTFLVGFFVRNFTIGEISIYTIATLVSALPESLPVILVVVLSIGAQRMAKKNAIVRKLSATETLGVVSVIITDKTGTLTQNIMSVKQLFSPNLGDINTSKKFDDSNIEDLRDLLIGMNKCNQVKTKKDEEVTYETIFGDPTEKSLFIYSHNLLKDREDIVKLEKSDDMPFQQDLRLRASIVSDGAKNDLYFTGAPESILEMCNLSESELKHVEDKMLEMSNTGLRMVALGVKKDYEKNKIDKEDVRKVSGKFLGLVGIYDPPRPEVQDALKLARLAHIRILMATGDHPKTAFAIAKEIGLVEKSQDFSTVLTQNELEGKSKSELWELVKDATVLARLTPNMKLKVLEAFQENGSIVAMTGDGVNDAPALKKADVGISMGQTGTDVARNASKIVLADDNFASIVGAIKEGRTQFNNLRRTSFFLIMTNISESAALLIALLIGFPLPLLPLQILWLNIITGGLTDIALSLEPTHDDSMKAKPRPPSENILNKSVIPYAIVVTTVTIIVALSAFHIFLPQGVEKARTALFVVLSVGQVLNMFNLRSLKKSVFSLGLTTNKPVVYAFFISTGLMLGALFIPFMQNILKLSSLTFIEISVISTASLSIFLSAEVVKLFTRKQLEKNYIT